MLDVNQVTESRLPCALPWETCCNLCVCKPPCTTCLLGASPAGMLQAKPQYVEASYLSHTVQHCQLKTLAFSAQAGAEGDALQADETAAAAAQGKSAAKPVAALAATTAATPVPKQAAALASAGQVKEGSQVKGAAARVQERAQVNFSCLFNPCFVFF